ncbi:MAG TPA: VOC family protein [Solirubrobacteraceae bacterium]|nr:VOC family protein [Solirubrobacteraceae bacterium]
MIDHVLLAVSDLDRSATFYDAVFFALGARRMPADTGDLAWGVDGPVLEIAAGEMRPAGAGYLALRAAGKAAVDAAHAAGLEAGGGDAGAPGGRPQHGPRGYGGALRDPDGQRLELISR